MTMPLKAKKICTSKVTIAANIGTWLCGVAIAVPLLSPNQKIYWDNDWTNQTEETVKASKDYLNGVSTGGLIVVCLLLGLYFVTFGTMIKQNTQSTLTSNQARKYKAEVNLTIQALLLTSFVFLYNAGFLLYTMECCPWFVAPNLVAMCWIPHYSGPILALGMSSVLRSHVKKFLAFSPPTVHPSVNKKTAN